jgi:HAD superfamily hydrolase (TIGR01509 family)
MTEEIDLITFDAGGTLFDMAPSRDEVFVRILSKRFGGLSDAAIAASLRNADRKFDDEFATQDGKNEGPFWKRYDEFVFRELGVADDSGTLHGELDAEFSEMIPKVESWVEYPETRGILERIKSREFKLGVISNATDLTKRVLDNLDLNQFFDFVIVSEEVGYRKPRPEIFRLAARMGKTAPNRSLHIGDKFAVDVVGASRAGMNAVLLDRVSVYGDLDCIRTRDLNFFAAFV